MASGLYSGVSGLALGSGLYRNTSGLWSGASGLIAGWGGSGASAALNINFLTGNLDPRITFSRASTATYTNSAGVITLAAVNAPRFDYYPDTLLQRGLMLEGSRTNVLLNSLINGTALSTQSVTVTAVPYTLTFYGTGQVVLSGAATATVVGTGAYPNRQTYTFTPTAGSLTLTVTGSVQYAQLEIGSWASSFIPTAGTATTRAADSATMTGGNFSGWYSGQTGTFSVGAEPAFGSSSQKPSILLVTDTLAINYQTLYVNGSTGNISYAGSYADFSLDFIGQAYGYTALPALQFALSNGIASKFSVYGQATAYATNDFASSGNGIAPSVDTAGVVPVTMTQMAIGPNDGILGYGGWFGWARNLSFYSSRLPNSDLSSLSAVAGASQASLALDFLGQLYFMGSVPAGASPTLTTDFISQTYVVG